MIKRAVDGLLSVVTLETTLPPLKDVTVTFLTAGFLAVGVATVLAVRVLVLRVLVLRAFGAVADLEAVDLTGIGIDSDVYSINIHEKTPLWGFGVHFANCLIDSYPFEKSFNNSWISKLWIAHLVWISDQ